MNKVYAIASQKGGVAKSSTVLNLGTALGLMGKKVLCIDLDPQGSLTICAGVKTPDKLTHTTYTLLNAVMEKEPLPEPGKYIIPCAHIDVIPCNIRLAAFETSWGHQMGVQKTLQKAINPLQEQYEIILIDTGPSLGVLTANAITASDGIIIPVTPQLLSAVGLKLLINTIETVKEYFNPNVAIEGILMTMCDTRTNLYKQINSIMEKTYSQTVRIFDTIIPHSTKVGEANLNCQSIVLYDEKSKPSQAYMDFAKELTNGA